MKSLILIATYLLRDTWQRWFEQPGSLLARALVTLLMAGLTMVLLVALQLQIVELEKQRKAFGLESLLLLEHVQAKSATLKAAQHEFSDLSKWGSLLIVKRLPVSAMGPQGAVVMMSYDRSALSTFENYLTPGQPNFLLSNDYPPGILLDLEHNGIVLKARTFALTPEYERLGQSAVLFVPSEENRHLEALGFVKLHLFTRTVADVSLEEIVAGINHRLRLDGSRTFELKTSLGLRSRINDLQEKQKRWRFVMAGCLGVSLALIYGVLSALEYRQNMFVTALIRSFGTSAGFLGLRTLLENLLIAFSSAFVAIFLLHRYHHQLFADLQIGSRPSDELLRHLYFGPEAGWLFCFVAVGVILSCLPVFLALRKPVGAVLN